MQASEGVAEFVAIVIAARVHVCREGCGMPLKIRLRREGRGEAPLYRIVIAEGAGRRGAGFVATIGHYIPASTPAIISVDREMARTWIDRGAVPTDTVRSLFRQAGVLHGGREPASSPEDVAAVDLLTVTLARMADLQCTISRSVQGQSAVISEFRNWMQALSHAGPERAALHERAR